MVLSRFAAISLCAVDWKFILESYLIWIFIYGEIFFYLNIYV